VLDGELLVLIDGQPDFDSLQLCMHSAESQVKKLSVDIPMMLMCFDLLVDAKGKDLRGEFFDDRRDAIEEFTGALAKRCSHSSRRRFSRFAGY
jgi:ATP-dependent DNA ligase